MPIGAVQPSPENDQLYRPVDPKDPDFQSLVASIRERGIREPLVTTEDQYVLSGHRRLAAAKLAGLREVPCRAEPISRLVNLRQSGTGTVNPDFLTLLREHNRQRVKTFAEALREEVVSASPEVAYEALIEHRRQRSQFDLDTLGLRGPKRRAKISRAKGPFLTSILKIIEEYNPFWPLSDRQIHYGLLNDPPLIHASKPGSVYRNDLKSYKSLTDLLTRARLAGHIPMSVIQDETRPVILWNICQNVQGYLRGEIENFAAGYWRDLLQSQPNHIELVGEKITVESIIRPVAMRYCIPMTIGRGYCSLRPRSDIAERFRQSGKERLILLIVGDHDPDGEEIAHSFARSLRDDFGIEEIEPIKVALTAGQVREFRLPRKLKAKKKSANYRRFADQHGDNVWELEALRPETLQRVLQDAIDQVIDVEAFNNEVGQEKADAVKLGGMREIVLSALRGWDSESR